MNEEEGGERRVRLAALLLVLLVLLLLFILLLLLRLLLLDLSLSNATRNPSLHGCVVCDTSSFFFITLKPRVE